MSNFIQKLIGGNRRVYDKAISDAADSLHQAANSFKDDQDVKNILILCSRELKATNRIDGERLRQNHKSFKGLDVENKPSHEPK